MTSLMNMLFKRHIDISWSKLTQRFLTVVLEANIKSANTLLSSLGLKTITSILSEFESKNFVDTQVLTSLMPLSVANGTVMQQHCLVFIVEFFMFYLICQCKYYTANMYFCW